MPECLWCARPFVPRAGGKTQRFCRPAHRLAFHASARRWAERAVLSGALSVAELKRASGNVHVGLNGVQPPAGSQVAPEAAAA